ncbi:MAG: phosphodiester glycosidase family protein [Gaiellaceae bacterium]
MIRKLTAVMLAAFAWAPTAFAQGGNSSTLLMPGVTYSRAVQFTAHGPVVFHIITAPKPGGLYSLQPVLANGTIVGRARVTDIEKSVSSTATVAGVNGDLFNWNDGHPSGVVMRNGVLDHPPLAGRTSIGIGSDGMLHLDRVSYAGYWKGTGMRRPVGLNDVPGASGVSLFTTSYGPATPASTGAATEAVLQTFPSASPNTDLLAVVSQIATTHGATSIAPGTAVLQARGSSASVLTAEAPLGTTVTIHLTLTPGWQGIANALGGGPLIVANGRAIFRANELFTTDQIAPRDPRTAVGQKADGSILLVTVDGRQPGYSVGVTNYDLAVALKRFGAVWASALDSGGSSTMAFDGTLLNHPSEATGERLVKEALLVEYTGVYEPPPGVRVLSPNGDNVDETQTLSYKLVRNSTVQATLTAPDKTVRVIDSGARTPGVYSFGFTGKTADGTTLEPEGTWHFTVTSTDDQGQTSIADRTFLLDNTLGFLTASPAVLALRKTGTKLTVSFTLTRPAKVTATIETAKGIVVKTILTGNVPAGPFALTWAGKDSSGRLAFGGAYQAHISASNELGTVDLFAPFAAHR